MSGDEIPWAWIKAVNHLASHEPWTPKSRSLPAEILPWLFLSDYYNVYSDLTDLHITDILSTNAMPKTELDNIRQRCEILNISHHFVSGKDELSYSMLDHWKHCRGILERVRESEGRILVHCVAGTNRSGLIACAAVMVLERHFLLDAFRLVKERRGTVLTNPAFQIQLCKLAVEEGLLGSKPQGFTNYPPASPTRISRNAVSLHWETAEDEEGEVLEKEKHPQVIASDEPRFA